MIGIDSVLLARDDDDGGGQRVRVRPLLPETVSETNSRKSKSCQDRAGERAC